MPKAVTSWSRTCRGAVASSRTAPSQGSASHPLDGEEPHHVPSRTGPSSSIKAVTEQPAKHGKLLEVQVPDRVWDRRDEAQRLRAEKAAAAGPTDDVA